MEDSSDMCTKSIINSEKKKSVVIKSRSGNHPLIENRTLQLSGLESVRQILASEGLSEKAISLISDSTRKSSISHYNSAWGKFSSWCNKREADPFRCAINLILEFLTESFEERLERSTLVGYRSAISAFHDEPIEGILWENTTSICFTSWCIQ